MVFSVKLQFRKPLIQKLYFSNWRLSCSKGCLPSKIVFHWKSSSIEAQLQLKVVFHQKYSSIESSHPSKVMNHQTLAFIKGCPLSKVAFHQKSSQSKVIFHQNGFCFTCQIVIFMVHELKNMSLKFQSRLTSFR